MHYSSKQFLVALLLVGGTATVAPAALAQDVDSDYADFLYSEEARLCTLASEAGVTASELDAAQRSADAILRGAAAELQLSQMIRAVFGAEALVAATDAYVELKADELGLFGGMGLGATRDQLSATVSNNQLAFAELRDALNGGAATDRQLASAATLTTDVEAMLLVHGAALAAKLGLSPDENRSTLVSSVIDALGVDVIAHMVANETMGLGIIADLELAEIPGNRVAFVLASEVHASVSRCIEAARTALSSPESGIDTDALVSIDAVLEIPTPGDDCATPPCGWYASFKLNVWGTAVSGDVVLVEPDWSVGTENDRHVRYGTATDDYGKIRRVDLGPGNSVDAVFSVINQGQFADNAAPLDLIMTGTLEQVPDARFPAGYQIGGSGVFTLPAEMPADWLHFFSRDGAPPASPEVGTWRLRLYP